MTNQPSKSYQTEKLKVVTKFKQKNQPKIYFLYLLNTQIIIPVVNIAFNIKVKHYSKILPM